ncbi:MAG: type II toxin-antitoxin system HicB family antitoxin [Verrucomicrobiales bacterium]
MPDHFLIVVEPSPSGYGAYSPDVPGCAAVGKNVEQTLTELRAALRFHFEGMIEAGEALPLLKACSTTLPGQPWETSLLLSRAILSRSFRQPTYFLAPSMRDENEIGCPSPISMRHGIKNDVDA